MSLTLITGPANAAKAGAVFERLRAALPRDPLLVVPTSADREHYQRELAASGIVFGAEVLTFNRLVREIAAAAKLSVRPLGPVARERVVRAAIAGVPLRVLARSAATPGFAAAAGALFAELQRSLVTPARFTSALRAWAGDRRAYADELAALYSAYRRRLEQLGRPDAEGYAWAALDALRAAPGAWGGRPVFFYGFDDLTPTQRDAVETLVRHGEADVVLALPYEPGRVAFAGRAATVEELRPLATVEHLPERSEHYAPSARPALHHLERSPVRARRLPAHPQRRDPAARGGRRARRGGAGRRRGAGAHAPGDRGARHRGPVRRGRGRGGPVRAGARRLRHPGEPRPARRPRPHAARGRRAGGGAGRAGRRHPGRRADLAADPGRLADPALADALEVRVRRGEVRSVRARAARSGSSGWAARR